MDNQTHSWNNRLKTAIVNEEIEAIARLHGEAPSGFESVSQAQESAALIGEAVALLRRKRDQLQQEIEQTKKMIAYQRSQLNSPQKRYESVI